LAALFQDTFVFQKTHFITLFVLTNLRGSPIKVGGWGVGEPQNARDEKEMFVLIMELIWLVVSTHLKDTSEIESFPQVGVNIKKIFETTNQ